MNMDNVSKMLGSIFEQKTRSTVVYLQGPPGIGKTAVPAQVAERMNMECIITALPASEAVDLRGLPQITDGATRWACPFPRSGRGVLVLDEISSAPSDVQVAAHHIVRSEPGSDIGVGDGWHIVLTGNRAADKSFFRSLGAPLRNRVVIVDCEADPIISTKYMMDHGCSPLVTGFLRWRPELLTAREIPADGPFPSPRAYEECSNILQLSVSAEIESEMLRGTIGQGAANELCAYLRTARELPSIEAIEQDQERADIPSSPSLLYALITSMSYYTRQTKKSLAKFASRCPAEFALLYIRDVTGHLSLKNDPDVRKWIGNHKKLFDTDGGVL